MSQRIDVSGFFRGTIEQHGITTSKVGKPMFNLLLKATQQYITDPAVLKEMGQEEPCFADVTAHDMTAMGMLLLFNDVEVFDASTVMFHVENIQKALGWEGASFDQLNDGSYVGKEISFEMELEEYDNKVSSRLQRIDTADANPERELRRVDADVLKELSAKLNFSPAAKPKPVSAKPKTAKPKTAKPKVTKSKVAPKADAPPAAAPPVADAPPAAAPPVADAPPAAAPPAAAPVEGCTKEEAWAAVYATKKTETTDQDVATAWMQASAEAEIDEATATPEQWATVRDATITAIN